MSQKFFQIIRPVHVHLKKDKVDLKKRQKKKKKNCIFFQSTHQVDMKKMVSHVTKTNSKKDSIIFQSQIPVL